MFIELNSMRVFFEEPGRQFHLRELGRIMDMNPVTVKRHLQQFVSIEALLCKKERNLELYSSNTENFYYKEYKKFYNKLKLLESGLLDFINEEMSMPTIILFGSYERGEDNTNSDIDIFVFSESKKELDLRKYEKVLKKPIQVHLMNKKEFERSKEKNQGLINSIVNGTVLSGFLEVL